MAALQILALSVRIRILLPQQYGGIVQWLSIYDSDSWDGGSSPSTATWDLM